MKNAKKSFHQFAAIGIEEDGTIKVKAKFMFPLMEEGDQYLFLSEDYDMLLELYGEEAMLYKLENAQGTVSTIEKTVKYKCRLTNLPIGLGNGNAYQLYCLFSPNLRMYFDVDRRDQAWVIKEASEDKQIVRKIPKTLLAYNKYNQDEILQQTKFMCWNTTS